MILDHLKKMLFDHVLAKDGRDGTTLGDFQRAVEHVADKGVGR